MKRLMRNPLAGIVPWIAFAVLQGPVPLWVAVSVALVLSVCVLAADRLSGSTTKILSVVDVATFAVILAVTLIGTSTVRNWLEEWCAEIAYLVLAVTVVASIAARVPFTIQYAKERVDPQYWNAPRFLKVNYVISGAWAVTFLIAAIAGFVGNGVLNQPNNVWTAWVIPVVAIIAAVRFSNWYPERTASTDMETT